MANINKIRLSGTTYNIEDENASRTVELTQAQYDALQTKDPNTYYVITDATAVDLANYYTKAQTDTALATKQATLVSGTNIKTINNESILGEGNITIQGGGGSVTVDDALSTTSENPVQNKVISANILGNYNTSYTGSPQKTVLQAYNKNNHGNSALSIGFSKINGTEIFKTYEFIDSLTANFELATQSDFETHTGDTTIHVTSSEKTAWNGAATNASNAITALGGLKLVSLTQAQYDAISTKDASTIYFING